MSRSLFGSLHIFAASGEPADLAAQTEPVASGDVILPGAYPFSNKADTLKAILAACKDKGIDCENPGAWLRHDHGREQEAFTAFQRAIEDFGPIDLHTPRHLGGCRKIVAVLEPCDKSVRGWLSQLTNGRHNAQKVEGRSTQLGIRNIYGDICLTGTGSTYFDLLLLLDDGTLIPVSIKTQWLVEDTRSPATKINLSSDGVTAVRCCVEHGMPYILLHIFIDSKGNGKMEWFDVAAMLRIMGSNLVVTREGAKDFGRGKPAPAAYYFDKQRPKSKKGVWDRYLRLSRSAMLNLAVKHREITFQVEPVKIPGGARTVARTFDPCNLPDGILTSAFRLRK